LYRQNQDFQSFAKFSVICYSVRLSRDEHARRLSLTDHIIFNVQRSVVFQPHYGPGRLKAL